VPPPLGETRIHPPIIAALTAAKCGGYMAIRRCSFNDWELTYGVFTFARRIDDRAALY